jgi:hypothetical protein
VRKTLDFETLPEERLNPLDFPERDDEIEVQTDNRLDIGVDRLSINYAVVDSSVGQQYQQLVEQICVIPR